MPTKNNSPNLDQYIPEGRKRYVSYYEGAQMYGLAYTGFVKACKEAGAEKRRETAQPLIFKSDDLSSRGFTYLCESRGDWGYATTSEGNEM